MGNSIICFLTGICKNFQSIRTFALHPEQFSLVLQEIPVLREKPQCLINIKLRFHHINSIAGAFHKKTALKFHKSRHFRIPFHQRHHCILRFLITLKFIIADCSSKQFNIRFQLGQFRRECTGLLFHHQHSPCFPDPFCINQRQHCCIKSHIADFQQNRMIKSIDSAKILPADKRRAQLDLVIFCKDFI